MIQAQAEAKDMHFMNRSITLNPMLIRDLGIVRNKCMIQTEDYKLSCVPYTLSLRDCKVLLILSPREQKIIDRNKDSNLMLHLEFHLPDYQKAVPMFIRVQIKEFQQLNSSRNQCLLTANYLNIPHEYKQLLVRHLEKEERYLQIYQSPDQGVRKFGCKEILRNNLAKQVMLRPPAGKKLSARIIALSMKSADLYIDTDEETLQGLPRSFLLEMQQNGTPFSLNASLADFTPSSEVEGYFIVRLALQFSISLADSLSSLFTPEDSRQQEQS